MHKPLGYWLQVTWELDITFAGDQATLDYHHLHLRHHHLPNHAHKPTWELDITFAGDQAALHHCTSCRVSVNLAHGNKYGRVVKIDHAVHLYHLVTWGSGWLPGASVM